MSRLLDALRATAGRRRRLPLDGVWHAFQQADPAAAADVLQRAHLRNAIDALALQGQIRLPRTRRRWDHSADPPLPAWVELVDESGRQQPQVERPPVAWAPELAFARTIRAPAQVEVLTQVQHFLAEGGRDRPIVPSRERSLELFGDEKRLDALASTRLFGEGRLSWVLLRCEPLSPPMVLRENADGQPNALIVENHHTWHTFQRWNASHAHYRMVAYGAGNAAWTSLGSLAEPLHDLDITRIEYFGDLDRTGLHIAVRLAALAETLGLPPVVPATRWYALLLDRADLIAPIEDHTTSSTPELAWFPAPLRARIAALLAAGRRLPQELVGWEAMQGQ